MRLLIVGAGGQGQVVADAALFARDAGQNIDVIGFLDDDLEMQNKKFLGITVTGLINEWKYIEHDALILGIGSNIIRYEVYEKLRREGAKFTAIIHPKAIIAHDAVIKEGSYIVAHVIIAAGSTVGINTIVHGNSVIGHHNKIGNHVHIAPGANTAGNIQIGDGSMVGIGATFMPCCTIGEWATIDAASLVNRNVLSGETVVGVPCRHLKHAR